MAPLVPLPDENLGDGILEETVRAGVDLDGDPFARLPCEIQIMNILNRPTDQVKGMPWLKVGNQGAEYGSLSWTEAGRDLKLGETVEIYCTTLDMSTNVYDRYYVARGEQIVDVWPIMGRSGAAQR